ncbi:hypothetical protein C7B64_13425 [Merismopedia glauca CCAP 1448/3]|uniref:Uncharacterized protein n=2 Tax=Merismopedia TaxID=53402 RepID=A0A2T1C290_9CYAN|nr:hypothetical protein C7B64_13425 [Merismopedia glauca CCAP 1448/3]
MRSFKSLKLPWQLPKWVIRLRSLQVNQPQFFPLIWIVPLAVLAGAIAWNLPRSKPKLANQWQPAQQVSNLADINLVIDTYLELSPEFTWESIAKELTATKVGSLTVYKFSFPNTCGFAGCLYVVSNGYAKSQALQLWDEPYFQANSHSDCLTVEQKSKNYEICLK